MANATPDRSDHVPLELDLAADIAKVQLSAADFLRSEADGPGELSAHPLHRSVEGHAPRHAFQKLRTDHPVSTAYQSDTKRGWCSS
jgi:hypothetical protein